MRQMYRDGHTELWDELFLIVAPHLNNITSHPCPDAKFPNSAMSINTGQEIYQDISPV